MISKDDELVKIAIVGYGLIGQRHSAAIKITPRAKLVAVVEPEGSDARLAVDPSVEIYADIEIMLADAKPDGVIVASPTTLHIAHAQKCIDAGIPTLIEKPISDDLDAARRLTISASKNSAPLLVGHHRRFNPIIDRAKGLMDSGVIGQVRAINAVCWFYKPDHYFEIAPWRKAPGAGPVSVNLIHDIDLIRYFCGEVVSVQARCCRVETGLRKRGSGRCNFVLRKWCDWDCDSLGQHCRALELGVYIGRRIRHTHPPNRVHISLVVARDPSLSLTCESGGTRAKRIGGIQ